VPKLAAALDSQGTWVVLTRPEDLDPRGAFVELMDRSPNAEAFTFEGVRVWHVPAGTTVNP
jgi:hypothetical protein